MHIGIISDAHGNAAGLMKCLDFMRNQGAERIVFLGDAVGYFPHAAAVCRLLLQADAQCIMGNTEAMLLGLLPLPPEKEEILRLGTYCRHIPLRWLHQVERTGPSLRLTLGECRLLLVHATPLDPLEGLFNGLPCATHDVEADIILTGHTHRPLCHQSGGQLFVNPGSCGYPRDHGTLLSLALLDTQRGEARIWRLPFSFRPALLGTIHEKTSACTQRVNNAIAGTIWESHA